MGYKLLGFVVWQGGKWYVRRRLPVSSQKLAIGAVAGVTIVAAGIVATQRRGDTH